MNGVEQFLGYVKENKLFKKQDKILLAVSGGKDSMLMLWFFAQAKIAYEIAHCNFQLRGKESDLDELLVKDYAEQLGIPFHVKRFDTIDYAEKHKLSIQMAAREMRYNWFEELRIQHNCAFTAIAQHKNDHVETVLLNLTRGTGLLGLQGILAKRDSLIRPLLFLKSSEIAELVQLHQIPFRDDESNFSNKYVRNKIRLDIVPQFEQMNADFVDTMSMNIERFQEANQVLKSFINPLRDSIFKSISIDNYQILKADLQNKEPGLLYFLFEPFGFSKATLEDMLTAFNAESGRLFESDNYQILVDRACVFLQKKEEEWTEIKVNKEDVEAKWGDFSFEVLISEDLSIEREAHIVKLDSAKVEFPLTIRSWKEGDIFQPLGMKGKKKVSDLFIQKKIPLFAKKRTAIWVNGNGDILWIAGIQMDERYKITENTQKVLKLVGKKQ